MNIEDFFNVLQRNSPEEILEEIKRRGKPPKSISLFIMINKNNKSKGDNNK